MHSGSVLIVVDSPPGTAKARTRDPDRKNRILLAASELIGRRGFHAVSIADIGNAAGITGSGVYRHFESKSAILVALFDQVIDDLIAEEKRILDETDDLPTALAELIEGQVEFVIGDRQLAQVYHNEINNLPEEDRRRLRRKQRLYLEEWVHLVNELREDLDDTEARVIVHAAIGAIQSPLFHNTGLADDRLRVLLADSARSILSTDRRTP